MQMMMQGDSWSHTFDEPGEYEYFCLPHVNMVATIIVE
jgi:plastocyanin